MWPIVLLVFVFNGTLPECFDLRKKKKANQWNKPKILLSLRGKSTLHCLSGFEFKHVLEGFAGKLHEEEACGSESADLIPSLGKSRSGLSCLVQPRMLELTLFIDFRLLMVSAAGGHWDRGTAVCTTQGTVPSIFSEGDKICSIMLHVCWHVSIRPNTF